MTMIDPPSQFPAVSGPLRLPGAAGQIEALAGVPAAAQMRPAVVLICHPHPLHGGSLHNKVVAMLERSFLELGLRTLRFNFRGVGASEGAHDHGDGETLDAIALGEWLQRVCPGHVLWLAGFSFGAMVAARFNPDLKAKYQQLASAGKPARIAITTVMRKLVVTANALLKANRCWQQSLA